MGKRNRTQGEREGLDLICCAAQSLCKMVRNPDSRRDQEKSAGVPESWEEGETDIRNGRGRKTLGALLPSLHLYGSTYTSAFSFLPSSIPLSTGCLAVLETVLYDEKTWTEDTEEKEEWLGNKKNKTCRR